MAAPPARRGGGGVRGYTDVFRPDRFTSRQNSEPAPRRRRRAAGSDRSRRTGRQDRGIEAVTRGAGGWGAQSLPLSAEAAAAAANTDGGSAAVRATAASSHRSAAADPDRQSDQVHRDRRDPWRED